MKSEIERRRHRRAVNTLGRLVLSTLGPLTLSLLFAPMSAARASTLLIGDVISGSYSYPCVTCTLTGEFSYFFNPFVVLAGPAETTLFLGNPTFYSAWNVNFEANSVTLTMAPAPLFKRFLLARPLQRTSIYGTLGQFFRFGDRSGGKPSHLPSLYAHNGFRLGR